MSKHKRVMQRNKRGAFVHGMTVVDYWLTYVWPKIRDEHAEVDFGSYVKPGQ